MSAEPWLTKADLEAAQALADAATPGPWSVKYETNHWEDYGCTPGQKFPYAIAGQDVMGGDSASEISEICTADAEFIAKARDLVPALLHRIRFQHDKAIRAQEFWEGKISGLQRDVDSFRFMFSTQCAKTERAIDRAEAAESLLKEISKLVAPEARPAGAATFYELRALLERSH
jgi:hypothetical protein